jgi:hypothetical protein
MQQQITVYNKHNVYNKRTKPSIIRIDCAKNNSRIRFSVEAVKTLGLSVHDCLTFITVKTDKHNIYFYKDNKNGLKLREVKTRNDSVYLEVNCRLLARKLLLFFGIKDDARSFIITNDTTKVNDQRCFYINFFNPYSGNNKPNAKNKQAL